MIYRCGRREFLSSLGKAYALAIASDFAIVREALAVQPLTDMHSQLTKAYTTKLLAPNTIPAAVNDIVELGKHGGHLAVCGSRHSAGGQEFATGAPLLDATSLKKVVGFDHETGILTVEAGIKWPAVIDWINANAPDWTFRQKQTGSDRLTIGGTLSSNAHGQGLRFKPIIGDVQSFDLVDATGKNYHCSRTENRQLFSLAIGGYGNFGLITHASLQLTKRTKFRRTVELCAVKDIPHKYRAAVESGCRYGDFQCNIDQSSPDFLRQGIWKQYQAVLQEIPSSNMRKMTAPEWEQLVLLAHTDRARAWKVFSERLLATNNAIEFNDFWQDSPYVDNYHAEVDRLMKVKVPATEVLTELYVPLDDVHNFVEDARDIFQKHGTDMVYSTIRFTERDDESFLPWARGLRACVIFNIHTEHSKTGIARTEKTCQALIDCAIKYGGSYYLTYHRYARKDQVLRCYPEFVEFLKLKRKYDPHRVFRSDWYAFYESMFATELG